MLNGFGDVQGALERVRALGARASHHGADMSQPAEIEDMMRAADQVIDGKVPDPTGGATHYYAIAMKKAPGWAAKAKETLRLGGHVFFKDVP